MKNAGFFFLMQGKVFLIFALDLTDIENTFNF